MTSDKRNSQASLRKIEVLAGDLSSSVQLSYAEPVAGSFYNEARAVVARTRRVYQDLVSDLSEQVKGTPGIDALLDNSHMIASALAEMEERWKRKETVRLPQVTDDEGNKRPRAYLIARSLVRESDAGMDRESVETFLRCYQRTAPLSVRELDIFPDMLRFVIIEELSLVMVAIRQVFVEIDEAERWFARLTDVLGGREVEAGLTALTNQLVRERKVVPVNFGFHLLQRIAQSGRERDLRIVSRGLRLSLSRQGVGAARLQESIAKINRAQAIIIDRHIAGLHWLGQMRWDRLSQPLNAVEAVLNRDPAGVYSGMTDETRAAYRRVIVRIAERTGAHDVEVAREALRRSRLARTDNRAEMRERAAHVGYQLIDDGLPALEAAFRYRPTVLEHLQRAVLAHPTAAYLGLIFSVTIGLTFLSLKPFGNAELRLWAFAILSLTGLVLSSEIAVVVAHLVFTRLIPPRPLPQMDCRRGIGASRRTIVVVPSFVRDQRATLHLLTKIETNFVANEDPDIYFAVLLDFRDAPAEIMPDDEAQLTEVKKGIALLNRRYPSEMPRFSLFCRKRLWNRREGVFMGWERKRGKLREFNRLLRGKPTSFHDESVAAAAEFGDVRYVLTVDEDTEISRDSAWALVGTIDHPLNRPVVDPARRVVTAGYGIVMPRSSLRFSEANASLFSRIFGGSPGIEAYSVAVSDLYQDLFREAIFQGKGIYDIDTVEATMEGRIPDDTVLSHDLLEGLYARTGTAVNAHVFEGFPGDYRSYAARVHRWIRGDWQIVPWLFTDRGAGFSAIGRWRIADNLRRSLLPVGLLFAVTGALFSPANSLYWSVLALVALGSGQLVPAVMRVLDVMTAIDKRFTTAYRVRISAVEIISASTKTAILGVLAPHDAFTAACAIVTSLWRLLVSKRKMLQWQTAHEMATKSAAGLAGNFRLMRFGVLTSLAIIVANFIPGIRVDRFSFIWATMWVSAPVMCTLLGRRRRDSGLSSKEAFYLRTVAAKTFWFFVDTVNKESQWLPPDHFQEEPVSKRHSYGLGVSPTNLGMYLLSVSAARALGLTTVTQYAERIARAFQSLSRMERYRGHFFNWYELRRLSPLAPRYVSSVDSANLALALLAVRNALEEACEAPLLSRVMFEGFDAKLAVLSEWSALAASKERKGTVKSKSLHDVIAAAEQTRDLIRKALDEEVTPRESDLVYSGAAHHAVRIRNIIEALRIEDGSEAFEDIFLAARHIEALAAENRGLLSQYLGHATVPAISAVTGDRELRAAYARLSEILAVIPSLNDLADGKTRERIEGFGFNNVAVRSSLPVSERDLVQAWYGGIIARLAGAEAKAREVRDKMLSSAANCRRYFDEMDFSFLYDEERGLFHMGYSASRNHLDDIFYDLFASEANSVSVVGIAKRQAPKEHWGYLSRKMVRGSDHSAVPVSWAGSLFEYLGTVLYFDIAGKSYWGVAARRAVSVHRHFARRLGIPWGMGESACSLMDAGENYHYQAFGEPSLGFKRDISESVVVAPYTTALALPVATHEAVRNLRQLERLGSAGRYGFYDGVDYTVYGSGGHGRGTPARIYYAHHQGFILSSIANAIHSGWVRRMIGKEPKMKVMAQLFEEKMPDIPPVEPLRVPTPVRTPANRRSAAATEAPRRYVSVRSREAKWNFLSNGKYRVALSSAGAGDSRYGEIQVTRSCEDSLTESRGTFHYLFDRERGDLWSPTYMPTKTVGEKSSASFGEQIVSYEKVYGGIASVLTVTVDQNAPVEVRELAVTNERDVSAVLTLGACAEVSLAHPRDALTHQNFENLFLASETVFDGEAVVVSRSDSHNNDHPVAACFLVTAPDGPPEGLRLVRDRESFYGSVVDRERPPILIDPGRSPSGLPRHTLDTAFGFVCTVTLRPGETRRIALVAGVGETPEAVRELLRPYRKYRSVRKVIAEAGRAGASVLSAFGVTSAQAETFGALASLVTARQYGASPSLQMDSAPLLDALWRCSISGVRPIVLLSVLRLADLLLVRQLLSCSSYFKFKGVEADFVILNEHRGGYLKTLDDEIDFLMRAHREGNQSRLGGICCVRVEELNPDELRNLRVAATVRVDSGRGSFSDQVQMHARRKATSLSPVLSPVNAPDVLESEDISRKWKPTDPRSLEHWNGIGGFDPKTGDYVILPKKNAFPPAPWSNIVANDRFGFLATDRGNIFSWSHNSHENKLTEAHNDPLSAETAEAFYVRDGATGKSYSPLPAIGDADAAYEIRHGQGYSEYRTHQGGLMIRLKMHVAPSWPVKYCSLSVRNDGKETRSLDLYGYFGLLLGSFASETKRQLVFGLREGNTLVAKNAFRNTFTENQAFIGIVGGADQFTVSREEFIGRFGSLAAPAGLTRQGLSSRLAADGEPAAALSRKTSVAPGEEKTVTYFLGEANSKTALEFLLGNVCREDCVSESLDKACAFWKSFPKFTFDLPDAELALLCNRFLPYQTAVSRLYGRLGFQQISGAFGFRDQLQDVLSLIWHDRSIARSHILNCAAHQFREGDVLSWWHQHNDFGARTLLSDPHLWLPYAVSRYVAFTGDVKILEESIPFLEGDVPDMERRSIVDKFKVGSESATLYEHCVRATERGLTFGPHGLPLMGAADWNDGMNRVGSEGFGESVWLAWLTVIVLRQMADFATAHGDGDRATRYRAEADRYLEAVERFGWDGSWYRRAYMDSGRPIGTQSGRTWRIDSVSQSWAAFALGKTARTEAALRSAEQELSVWEGHIPLAWPPSDPDVLNLGTLSDYPPGVRENAGQYNHAAVWLAQALFIIGAAEAGKAVIDAVNPLKRSATLDKALTYRGEPYAVAADVYSEPTYPGRAGWTWYTASAGTLYATVVEYLLGIRIGGNFMTFKPALPSDWKAAGVRYVHGAASYVISYVVESADVTETAIRVSLDGAAVVGARIALVDDGGSHDVMVRIVRPSPSP